MSILSSDRRDPGVQENAAAFFVELSPEDRAHLEEIFAPGKVCLREIRYTCTRLFAHYKGV
jgi:hypothetical protein